MTLDEKFLTVIQHSTRKNDTSWGNKTQWYEQQNYVQYKLWPDPIIFLLLHFSSLFSHIFSLFLLLSPLAFLLLSSSTKTSQLLWCLAPQPLWNPAPDQHFNDTNPSASIKRLFLLTIELLMMSSTPTPVLVLFFHVPLTVIILPLLSSSLSYSYSSTHHHHHHHLPSPLPPPLSSSSSLPLHCRLILLFLIFLQSPCPSRMLSTELTALHWYILFQLCIRPLLAWGQGQGKQNISIWTLMKQINSSFGRALK